MKRTGLFFVFCLAVSFWLGVHASMVCAQESGKEKKAESRPAAGARAKNASRDEAKKDAPARGNEQGEDGGKKDPRKKGNPPHHTNGARQDNRDWAGAKPGTVPGLGGGLRWGNFGELKKKHPELFELIQRDMELNKKTAELVQAWKEAAPGDKDALKAELREVATEHFTVREDRQLYELKLLEERIQRMRKESEKRKEKMEKVVNRRVKDLLERDDDADF